MDTVSIEPGDRWQAVVRAADGTHVGRASGARSRLGVTFEVLHGEPMRVRQALLGALGPGPVRTAVDLPLDEAEAEALAARGFVALSDWIEVTRTLAPVTASLPHPFVLHPLAAFPDEVPALVAAATDGVPDYAGAASEDILDDLRALAPEGGTDLWSVATRGGRVVGLVLPNTGPVGTLAALGLAPWARGRGWGSQLHAIVLEQLARSGSHAYVDATQIRNHAMRAVFERNRCVGDRTFRMFVRPPA